MPINVLLADDHNIFREGLKSLLSQQPDIRVVAETDNGFAAVERSRAVSPDIAILDVKMPSLNGIDAARRIRLQSANTKVIILSMHIDKEYVMAALNAGATGFIAKECFCSELVAAIHTVADGAPYLSPTISGALVDGLRSPEKEEKQLSQREQQVLRLIAEGMCTKEIAFDLGLSTKTVETYRQNLMKKLQITTVANLVRYAIREGIAEL